MANVTFTAEQKALYDALGKVDARLLIIARDVMAAWLATDLDSGPDPEDLGAPVTSPAWAALEDAMDAFDKTAGGDDEAKTRAALDVTNAILSGRV